MLQFITNTESGTSVVDQIKGFIAGGGRWVQIRMKESTDEEVAEVVKIIKPLCIETETFLLLDDRVELAKTLDVGGVHLGKDDMPPSEARMILGPAAVIGVTANTIDDIKAVRSLDVDYIGIGPFSETRTKKNLSPILGMEGIKDICSEMLQLDIDIPHVAIGGVKLDDIAPLMNAGVNGIAVSGAIANSCDIAAETTKFIERLKPFMK